MIYLKVTHEGDDSVDFEVRDTVTKVTRAFRLVFMPFPDGSARLLKQMDFPVKVEDFKDPDGD